MIWKTNCDYFTNLQELSLSWEAFSSWDSQYFHRIFWNRCVHCHFHSSTSILPILSQINPIHNLASYLCKIYCNIILPSMSRYSSGSFPSGFPIKTSTHLIFLDVRNLIIFRCRSQWPRGLRRRSAAARLLRSWVRNPPGAWMFVSCECRVMSGRFLCDELITRPEGSYWLWCVVVCDLETSRMRRPWPTGGLLRQNKKIICRDECKSWSS
jgi:hypothetical protein